MKYLKLYETYHTENNDIIFKYFDFHIGDYVKLTSDGINDDINPRIVERYNITTSTLFIVTMIDDDQSTALSYYITLPNTSFEIWMESKFIIKASEEETTANKYNL